MHKYSNQSTTIVALNVKVGDASSSSRDPFCDLVSKVSPASVNQRPVWSDLQMSPYAHENFHRIFHIDVKFNNCEKCVAQRMKTAASQSREHNALGVAVCAFFVESFVVSTARHTHTHITHDSHWREREYVIRFRPVISRNMWHSSLNLLFHIRSMWQAAIEHRTWRLRVRCRRHDQCPFI